VSISTFTELKTAIKRQSARDDLDSQLLDDFIQMAEQDMYAPPDGSSGLRLRSMESQQTTAITSGRTMALPDDYMELRRLRINDDLSGDLVFRAPNQLNINAASGRPRFFTITDQVEFDREVDGTYNIEFQFLKQLTPLSTSNQTNDALTRFPSMYLYGALYHAMTYAEEDARADRYMVKFLGAIRAASKRDKKGRFSPASGWSAPGPTP